MDLEHPAITKAQKWGYPDGAGKPQQKNTNPFYYNRVEEDEQMDFTNEIKSLIKMQESLKSHYGVIDVMQSPSGYSVQFSDLFSFYNLFKDTSFTIQEDYYDNENAKASLTTDGIEYIIILDNKKLAELEELINE